MCSLNMVLVAKSYKRSEIAILDFVDISPPWALTCSVASRDANSCFEEWTCKAWLQLALVEIFINTLSRCVCVVICIHPSVESWSLVGILILMSLQYRFR